MRLWVPRTTASICDSCVSCCSVTTCRCCVGAVGWPTRRSLVIALKRAVFAPQALGAGGKVSGWRTLVSTTDTVRILPCFHLRSLLLMLRVLIKLCGILILSYFCHFICFFIFLCFILLCGDSCHFSSISVTSILHILLLCGFCLLIFLLFLFCFQCWSVASPSVWVFPSRYTSISSSAAVACTDDFDFNTHFHDLTSSNTECWHFLRANILNCFCFLSCLVVEQWPLRLERNWVNPN